MKRDLSIETYRRKSFLKSVNAAYALLRKNPKEWAHFQGDRKAWDSTLMDGLENPPGFKNPKRDSL